MNPYQYCTRCGTELPTNLKERYQREHNSGPVLCRSCVVEIIQGIPDAIGAFISAFTDGDSNES